MIHFVFSFFKKNDDSIHRRRSLQMQKFHLPMELLFSLAVTIVISRACNNGVASFHSSTVVSINSSPLGRQISGVCRIFFFKGGVLQLDAARDAVMKKSLKKKNQLPRHGVGVSSYMTDHSDKQVKKENTPTTTKPGAKGGGGGVWTPLTPHCIHTCCRHRLHVTLGVLIRTF